MTGAPEVLAMRPPAAMPRGTIIIEDVVKIYDPAGAAILAVDHCSLVVPGGEILMMVGPSGCGKTTLLNAIAGFHDITSGRILLDGEELCSTTKPQATPGADRIVVFQNGALFPWKTCIENIAFGPVIQGRLSHREAREKARDLMADAGLTGVEHSYPGELSSGMRRRIEIVRALINDPKVLLLDEPYRALDSLTKSVMHESLLEVFYRNRVTVFFITHDLDEAIFLGHRVVISTARPCRPKKIIDVDIPHPRDYGVVTSKAFRRILEETSEAVRDEALKSFQSGEREG